MKKAAKKKEKKTKLGKREGRLTWWRRKKDCRIKIKQRSMKEKN